MFIKDLQPRMGNVDVEGVVEELTDVREFSKFGKAGKVCSAFIKDGTGKVKLSLWNEQIEKVKVGDTVKVTKGYVSEFQGELQLTTGKFGALEVVSGDTKPAEEAPAESGQEPASPAEPEPQPEAPAETAPETKKPEPAPESSLDVEEEDLS